MSLKNSSLPKYIFEWKGALILFLGALAPSIIIAFVNVFFMFFMKENFQYNDAFLLISKVGRHRNNLI